MSEHPVFALENVSFAYPSGRAVLRDVSFAFRAGEKIGLYGSRACLLPAPDGFSFMAVP